MEVIISGDNQVKDKEGTTSKKWAPRIVKEGKLKSQEVTHQRHRDYKEILRIHQLIHNN